MSTDTHTIALSDKERTLLIELFGVQLKEEPHESQHLGKDDEESARIITQDRPPSQKRGGKLPRSLSPRVLPADVAVLPRRDRQNQGGS